MRNHDENKYPLGFTTYTTSPKIVKNESCICQDIYVINEYNNCCLLKVDIEKEIIFNKLYHVLIKHNGAWMQRSTKIIRFATIKERNYFINILNDDISTNKSFVITDYYNIIIK